MKCIQKVGHKTFEVHFTMAAHCFDSMGTVPEGGAAPIVIWRFKTG